MIVDVHTHSPYVKADLERQRWVEEHLGITAVPGASTATSTLLDRMRSAGVGRAVCFSYHMRTDRLAEMNRRAVELLAHPQLIPFGGIHPSLPHWQDEIGRLKGAGVKGIKVHCNSQSVYPDSPDMFPIYEEIGDALFVTFHAGGYFLRGDAEVYGTAERLMRVREAFPRLKMILAHFGGNYMLDMARRHVIGRDVYVDTAWPPSLRIIGDAAVVARIIRDHGPERVLFGTDFPYGDPAQEIAYISELPLLSDAEKEQVLGGNAASLFGLRAG